MLGTWLSQCPSSVTGDSLDSIRMLALFVLQSSLYNWSPNACNGSRGETEIKD